MDFPKHTDNIMNSNELNLLTKYKLMYFLTHTPSIAFQHLPPNSARFSYTTEGALFISAQLSTDTVSALRKVWVLIRIWKKRSREVRT